LALVRIGKVARAVGLKGFLGVAGSDGALGELEAILLRQGTGEPERRRIEEARPQGRVWAVKLEGVSDRTAAERLVGAEVLAPRDELAEPGEGQLLWVDLEGLEVVTAAGAVVGRVTGPGGEKLVPLAPYVTVEKEAGRIVVDPPDGLLD